ncbi:MAG: alkaline phosphatase family protein [Candidatus Lernaella stagnicola]|nr:alkaline phosphatase family protein [Candidatus Lernaella stagnicola]
MNRRIFVKGMAGATAALAVGCGTDSETIHSGMSTKDGRRLLVIAFDGFDPRLARRWMEEGRLPNLMKLRNAGSFSELITSIPPQSPVAWSNFITGVDPGGHGIFDFIHRDPKTYLPFLSTSKAESPSQFWKIGNYKFPRDGGDMKLLRKGKAFWEYLADNNVPATVVAIPSNFPPVEGPFRSLSGMGTPDLLGGYGSFSYFTDDPPPENPDKEITGGKVFPVDVVDGIVEAAIVGPKNTYVQTEKGQSTPDAEVPFRTYVDTDAGAAVIELNAERFTLKVGEWSEWKHVDFTLVPGVVKVGGNVRFLLKSVTPSFALYVSPINIDPSDPVMPISTPGDYAKELSEEAMDGKPYYTQGIAEDTKALSSGIFTNAEFLQQAEKVFEEKSAMYRYELSRFKDGFLFFYFSASDLLTHMFWRTMEPDHPAFDPVRDGDYVNVVRDTYEKLDKTLGDAMKLIDEKTALLVMSDHGFAPYRKSFHVSSWLLDQGYITLRDTDDRAAEFLANVNWYGTKAYTLGINGIYLNQMGREKNGIVGPADADRILDEIVEKLLTITDPENGKQVVSHVYKTSEVYHGEYAKRAPDLIVGFARGYRASWETALGSFPEGDYLRKNTDAWGGDHCMATEEVPGVLYTSQPIKLGDPSLLDLPVTILEYFDIPRPPQMKGRNVFTGK